MSGYKVWVDDGNGGNINNLIWDGGTKASTLYYSWQPVFSDGSVALLAGHTYRFQALLGDCQRSGQPRFMALQAANTSNIWIHKWLSNEMHLQVVAPLIMLGITKDDIQTRGFTAGDHQR